MSLTPASAGVEKVTPQTLLAHKRAGTAITAITAYDCPAARQADESGIDLILVGDSLAMAVLGHPDTLSVTLAEMIHHARAVRHRNPPIRRPHLSQNHVQVVIVQRARMHPHANLSRARLPRIGQLHHLQTLQPPRLTKTNRSHNFSSITA